MWFFCQVLQYSRTIVLLKKLKPLKKPKRRWSCDFPPRKTSVAQKHRAISRQENMAFSTPRRVVLGLPSPSRRVVLGLPSSSRRVCADVRTYVRTDGRTDGHVTITSQPKFFGSIGYQICLAMELRSRALPAGSAITCYHMLLNGFRHVVYNLAIFCSYPFLNSTEHLGSFAKCSQNTNRKYQVDCRIRI